MTAVLRIGGEWTPHGTGGSGSGLSRAGNAFHGLYGNQNTTVITPGRTGGAMFKCTRSDARGGGFMYAGASHTSWGAGLVANDGPPLDRESGATVRAYLRLNQYPTRTTDRFGDPVADPGIPILGLTAPTGDVGYVQLFNDGTFGVAYTREWSAGIRMLVPDEYQFPLNDWLMVELAIVPLEDAQHPRYVIRVTPPIGRSRIVYCHVKEDIFHSGISFPSLTGSFSLPPEGTVCAGQLLDGGADAETLIGMEMFVDDVGLNTLDDVEPHNTWCGPGQVRVARPDSGGGGHPFECGLRGNIGYGQHSVIPDHPSVPFTAVLKGPPSNLDMSVALRNNPVVNPGAPAGHFADLSDIAVCSSGSDWHAHQSVYSYDWPRESFPGQEIDFLCDASDRVGAVAFVMPVAVAAMMSMSFSADRVLTEYRTFSIYLDNEDPPTPGDITDRATIAFNFFGANTGTGGSTFPGTDQAWWGAVGRQQQAPDDFPDEPLITIRRDNGDNGAAHDTIPHTPSPTAEFVLLGVGVVYESGYEPQPPIPDCGAGFIEIGPMISGLRQIKGGRLGNDDS